VNLGFGAREFPEEAERCVVWWYTRARGGSYGTPESENEEENEKEKVHTTEVHPIEIEEETQTTQNSSEEVHDPPKGPCAR